MKLITALLVLMNPISLGAKEAGCLKSHSHNGPYDEWGFPVDTSSDTVSPPKTPEEELEKVFSLMAYAVVYKDWQSEDSDRGHNFGAVLVNPQNEVVHWAVNTSQASQDDSQHAEVRLIQQYIQKAKIKNLKGFSIYVAGDSCPMCAGMISQMQIKKAVLGLSNPFFGKNFDRMNLNSVSCGSESLSGLLPISRTVEVRMSSVVERKLLDQAFRLEVAASCQSESYTTCQQPPSQTIFLKSPKARRIFHQGWQSFLSHQLKFPLQKAKGSQLTNQEIYQRALAVFEGSSETSF